MPSRLTIFNRRLMPRRLNSRKWAEASDEAWEQLKVGVESAWGALSTAIRNAAAKFKD
jgi:hypothetical protein